MRRFTPRGRPRSGVLALAVVVVVAAGAAYAAIPGPGGVIHGCIAKSTGSLRVIDNATQTCKSNETALSWNQQGQPGPAGAPAVVNRTVLHYSNAADETGQPGEYVLLRTIGTFTKQQASTVLRVTLLEHDAAVNGICNFQLRVDGLDDRGNVNSDQSSGATVVVVGTDNVLPHIESATFVDTFDEVGAGSHQLQMYVRGNGNPCSSNPGGHGVDAVVEEMP